MVIAQALPFEDGFRIVEAADEQVEFDKFSFHKTILSPLAHLLPLLLIRIIYPDYKTGVIVLSNFGATNPSEVSGTITRILLKNKLRPPPAPDVNPAALKDYVGRYVLEQAGSNFIFDVTLEGGQLYLKPSHFQKRRLVPVSGEGFYDEDDLGDTQFKFTRDEGGKVNGLVHLEAAASVSARKIFLPPPSLTGNTTFRLEGYPDAGVVALAGTFNNWNQTQTLCAWAGGAWVCRINLAPGKHAYKFVVDGNWITDPANARTESDGNGNVNSVIIIKDE